MLCIGSLSSASSSSSDVKEEFVTDLLGLSFKTDLSRPYSTCLLDELDISESVLKLPVPDETEFYTLTFFYFIS